MPKRKRTTLVEAQTNLTNLANELESLNRGPFKKMLALILGVQPTKASMQRFANKAPDRWAQALSVLGVLAGYERGAEVQINFQSVHGLSDAELLREAGKRGVRIIEGEALPVQELTGDGPRELTPTNSGPMVAAEAAIGSMPQELGTSEDNA